ncbi:MAG: D-alanyl-D-alanine carboxypeptidase family protein [Rhodanobacteraceae bacterium]
MSRDGNGSPARLAADLHAGDFGFQLSYPPDDPRGIEFESWHWRYVAEEGRTPRSAEANDTDDRSTD